MADSRIENPTPESDSRPGNDAADSAQMPPVDAIDASSIAMTKLEQSVVEIEIVDVWSRTQPKYRIRAVVLLLVNLLLFCGLCIFEHWLHFARVFDFSLSGYLNPARFWDAGAPNLTDFILAPINVVDVPLHAIVLGLVVAVMVAVPIVVAILYRFRYALPFVAAVLVFAHMPWMAVTLLGSCILASVRPFRMKFRFGSALVGLLPVLLYLYLASKGTPDQLADYGAPTQKSLLIAPWLIAVLAAAIMLGAVLLIARIVNYRPGAIAPVLGVMFTIPVALFHIKIGADELAYRVLEAEYGPRSKRFEPTLKSRETENAIYGVIAGEIGRTFTGQIRSNLRALWSLQPEKLRELKRTVSRRFLAEFLADRAEAYEACKEFIADYPHSKYIPNVLYIQGRVLDTRLDEAKLAYEEPSRELYTDFPHVQSEEIWLTLLKRYAESPLAVQAGLRLGELALRFGRIEEALADLELVLKDGNEQKQNPTTQPRQYSLLSTAAPESRLDFQPEPYRREARRLAELIMLNRDDAKYGDAPLVELARLDPRRAGYQKQLQRLAQRYLDSKLYDNLLVRWAACLVDIGERTKALEAFIAAFKEGDALPEALYVMANLEIQSLAATDENRRVEGIARLRDIVAQFPDSCWARRAAERLEVMEPGAVENGITP